MQTHLLLQYVDRVGKSKYCMNAAPCVFAIKVQTDHLHADVSLVLRKDEGEESRAQQKKKERSENKPH